MNVLGSVMFSEWYACVSWINDALAYCYFGCGQLIVSMYTAGAWMALQNVCLTDCSMYDV